MLFSFQISFTLITVALEILQHAADELSQQLHCTFLHIQCGSMKSNAILTENTQTYKVYSYSFAHWNSLKCQIFLWDMNEILFNFYYTTYIFLSDTHHYPQRVLLCASAVIMYIKIPCSDLNKWYSACKWFTDNKRCSMIGFKKCNCMHGLRCTSVHIFWGLLNLTVINQSAVINLGNSRIIKDILLVPITLF